MGASPIASSMKKRFRRAFNEVKDLIDTARWMLDCRRRDRYGFYRNQAFGVTLPD